MMSDHLTVEQRRVIYRARRGLKELDEFFSPYIAQYYVTDSLESQVLFAQLVACEDPDLLDWFTGVSTPPSLPLQVFIERLINLRQSNMSASRETP